MRPERLLERLRSGSLDNVRFRDFRRLVESLGFELVRVRGSHHVYRSPKASRLISLQDSSGEAKPYQIRQFLRTIGEEGLGLEGRR